MLVPAGLHYTAMHAGQWHLPCRESTKNMLTQLRPVGAGTIVPVQHVLVAFAFSSFGVTASARFEALSPGWTRPSEGFGLYPAHELCAVMEVCRGLLVPKLLVINPLRQFHPPPPPRRGEDVVGSRSGDMREPSNITIPRRSGMGPKEKGKES